jgi:hypothetical protein
MTEQVEFKCDQHPDARACPDKLVDYVPKFNEYGLLIHDGGSSFIEIHYCPWCGADLGATYRLAWFRELDGRGLEPEDDLPAKLRDDRWWREGDPRPD